MPTKRTHRPKRPALSDQVATSLPAVAGESRLRRDAPLATRLRRTLGRMQPPTSPRSQPTARSPKRTHPPSALSRTVQPVLRSLFREAGQTGSRTVSRRPLAPISSRARSREPCRGASRQTNPTEIISDCAIITYVSNMPAARPDTASGWEPPASMDAARAINGRRTAADVDCPARRDPSSCRLLEFTPRHSVLSEPGIQVTKMRPSVLECGVGRRELDVQACLPLLQLLQQVCGLVRLLVGQVVVLADIVAEVEQLDVFFPEPLDLTAPPGLPPWLP
jgi:hypothetical protein